MCRLPIYSGREEQEQERVGSWDTGVCVCVCVCLFQSFGAGFCCLLKEVSALVSRPGRTTARCSAKRSGAASRAQKATERARRFELKL